MTIRQVIRLYACERAQGELYGMLRTFNLEDDAEREIKEACEQEIEQLFSKLSGIMGLDDGRDL